jgi:hypothetical protein
VTRNILKQRAAAVTASHPFAATAFAGVGHSQVRSTSGTDFCKSTTARQGATVPASYMIPAAPFPGMGDIQVTPMTGAEFFVATLELRWCRLPSAKAREPWTGLSRSVINTLILPSPANRFKPPVESASFRQPGQRKATRLIRLYSLLAYVAGQAQKTAAAAGATKRANKIRRRRRYTNRRIRLGNPAHSIARGKNTKSDHE